MWPRPAKRREVTAPDRLTRWEGAIMAILHYRRRLAIAHWHAHGRAAVVEVMLDRLNTLMVNITVLLIFDGLAC